MDREYYLYNLPKTDDFPAELAVLTHLWYGTEMIASGTKEACEAAIYGGTPDRSLPARLRQCARDLQDLPGVVQVTTKNLSKQNPFSYSLDESGAYTEELDALLREMIVDRTDHTTPVNTPIKFNT